MLRTGSLPEEYFYIELTQIPVAHIKDPLKSGLRTWRNDILAVQKCFFLMLQDAALLTFSQETSERCGLVLALNLHMQSVMNGAICFHSTLCLCQMLICIIFLMNKMKNVHS